MRWLPKEIPNETVVTQMQTALDISETLARLLVQRGIHTFDSAKAFFRPKLADLHNPFLMKDMDRAIHRLDQAIASDEKVMVYGDYDVDGTTAVALVSNFLKQRLTEVIPYIPDRYSEGYGISFQGIDYAHQNKVGLMIALDCGIKAIDKAKHARDLGLDLIICDHHLPGETLPEAVAVLDPKRPDCSYPYKELCGCGIGFKLIQAWSVKQAQPMETLIPYLDLVVTAIAADIVPITGENRVMAHFGLTQFNQAPRPAFQFFLKSTQRQVRVSDLVFKIAPRINAAGRMKHGLDAVKLLCSRSEAEATAHAEKIETYNTERKTIDAQITQEALAQIQSENETNNFSSVVFDPAWHKGVIGIVASRLIEHHYRPTVVFTQSGEYLTGSVRSVAGFDVYEALTRCEAYMVQYGGHKYAAGLTIKAHQFAAFKTAFEKAVKQYIRPEQREPVLYYDQTIDFATISQKLYRILSQMAPFGPHNMQPVFRTDGCLDTGGSRIVGSDQTHLRVAVQDASGTRQSGIAFGMAGHLEQIKSGTPFSMLYTLEENEYNGTISLQLKVKDIAF